MLDAGLKFYATTYPTHMNDFEVKVTDLEKVQFLSVIQVSKVQFLSAIQVSKVQFLSAIQVSKVQFLSAIQVSKVQFLSVIQVRALSCNSSYFLGWGFKKVPYLELGVCSC